MPITFVLRVIKPKNMVFWLDHVAGLLPGSRVVFFEGGDTVSLKNLHKERVPAYGSRFRRLNKTIQLIRLILLLRSDPNRIVCCVGLFPGLFVLLAKPLIRARFVWRFTGAEVITVKEVDYGFCRKLHQRCLLRLAQKAADAIVVPSSYCLREGVRNGLDARKTVVIPNSVPDIKTYTPTESEKMAIAQQYGMSRDKNIVLFVGVLREIKGLRFLVAALEYVIRSVPDAHLVIGGTGPYEAEMKSQVARLGLNSHVTFLGWVAKADVPVVHSLATVYVQPSLSESFGNPVVDSLLQEVPVVMSDRVGALDGVNREYVCLFESGNVEQLSKVIVEQLENPIEVVVGDAIKTDSFVKWQQLSEVLGNHGREGLTRLVDSQ